MVIVLCDCNWDIPGVEKLPWHSHGSWAMVLVDGQEFRVPARDVALNSTWEVLDRWDDIHMPVDWKAVAHP